MDAYPCPACGGVAEAPTGCRRCGRAHDPEAAALAELNRRLAGLDERNRQLAADQSDLRDERAQLQAEAETLRASLRRQLTIEAGAGPAGRVSAQDTLPARPAPPAPAPAEVAPPAEAASPADQTVRTRQAEPVRTVPHPPEPDPTPVRPTPPGPAGVPRQREAPEPIAETSPRSARNTLLTLGGVLLGIAAVVVTGLLFTAAATAGRAAILAVATLIALTVPLLLSRRTLTATAETLAGFGLLAVLLDGYAAYSVDILGLGSTSLTLYSSVLCGLVAAIAAAYRLASHLRAPQYATLIAVQPVFPLLAAHLSYGRDGFAVVFAVVAALNLSSVEILGRDPARALSAALRWARLPGLAPGPGGAAWPPRLRETAWVFFGATLTTSTVLAVVGLVRARTDAEASRSALVLLLAAAVGVAGGLLARRPPLGQIAGGAAAFATILAVNRVNALALPKYALVLTAGVAAAIALGCNLLPRRARAGPRWGSLLGAGLTGVLVVSTVAAITVETVGASVTPRVWDADVAAFAERVRVTGDLAGQAPAAAALLAVLAVAAVPRGWRVDALVAGLAVVTLALPGTGAVAWWAVPVLGWGVSTVALALAVPARKGTSAVIRAASAGVVGAVAVASSLARPGLTAVVCALVALVAAATGLSVALARGRIGPYADRVADAAVGAGACTLPVAVGTAAHLAGAQGTVLVPVTLLATALGVEAAMLAQVSTSLARVGSAVGALGASAGAVLVAAFVDGATPADVGVAVLLGVGAVVAVSAGRDRGDLGIRMVVEDQSTMPSPRSTARWPVHSRTIAAGLATAALVLALARVGAVVLPGIGLVMTTAMVLVVAIGVAVLPRAWRAGPRLGSVAVGAGAVALAAGIAVVEAARTLAASTPYWQADLEGWSQRVGSFAPYGAAVPVSLLLAAVAAVVLLPRPANVDVFFVLACFAGLALPAVIAGPWWSAPLVAGGLAALAGAAAAVTNSVPSTPTQPPVTNFVPSTPTQPPVTNSTPTQPPVTRLADPPGTHRRRLALAGVLALYAVAAGGVTPAATGAVLFGIVGLGVIVAALASVRREVPPSVPGLAAGTAIAAAPGAAASTAIAFGTDRAEALGLAVVVCAAGVLVVVGLRLAAASWDGYPGAGVGVAAVVIAIASAIPDPSRAGVWAAACALLATIAAGHARPLPRDDDDSSRTRVVSVTLAATAIPVSLFAAAMSTPAWVSALVGPYRTLEHVWEPGTVLPEPTGAFEAFVTLLLLAPASGGMALILGGRRFLLAAVLPPLAAAAVVLPGALGASRDAVPWVALGVALATGLGAALSRPSQPSAATWLRATAGVVCALTGGAGLAGSLARPGTTLAALAVLGAGALTAALFGRDPIVRAVAWVVFAAAGFALPPTAVAAGDGELRTGVFAMLAVCAVLVALAWLLARRSDRYTDATVVEFAAIPGAGAALALSYGSIPYCAAVLFVGGVLIGGAALRPDRSGRDRDWLVRLALATELAACWLLLYGVHIGLPEAYTLPFAAAALIAGVIEQRRRPYLSSWVAYGPALAGAFLPSVALILARDDPAWRWGSVFLAAVAIVIVGSWRGWRAPVVTGGAIAVLVAIVEMVWLIIDGQIAGAFLVGLAGATLIVFGALAERRLRPR